MADSSPPNPQPNPNDPWLEGLNFDQVGQLINEVSPEVFHQRAAAFDQAGARLQEVLDLVKREMNAVHEAWRSKAAEDFDAVVRQVTGKVDQVLQHLQSPGYGSVLRDAGGRLAQHQQRFRDLQGQKTAQQSAPPAPGADPAETEKLDNDSAKQILHDLRTAYWDVGNALSPLPYKPPASSAGDVEANVRNSFGGNANGHGGGGGGASGPDAFGATGNPGPTTPFGGAAPTTSAITGDVGGGGPVRFWGQNGNVLGRVDPAAPGPGAGAPAPLLASSRDQGVSGVLGQTRASTGARGPDEGAAADTVVPGILGRSVPRVAAVAAAPAKPATPLRGKEKLKECRERDVFGEPATEPTERPEHVPDEVSEAAGTDRPVTEPTAPATHALTAHMVSTTTSGPAVGTHADLTPQQRHEVAAAVATAGTGAIVPDSTVDSTATAPHTPVHTPAALQHALEIDAPGRPQVLSYGSDGGSGGVHQVVDLDPGTHGMVAPGTTTSDGLVGQTTPETIHGAAAAGRGASPDPSAGQHMSGMPMGMGMGMGIGGMGGAQQGGRMAALPNEPRPEVWDPLGGGPAAVGKRARQAEEDKPGEKLTQAEIQAALEAKFAELDRLTERGK